MAQLRDDHRELPVRAEPDGLLDFTGELVVIRNELPLASEEADEWAVRLDRDPNNGPLWQH